MAELRLEDGTCLKDFDVVVAALQPLGVTLGRAPVDRDPRIPPLLAQPVLDADQAALVLDALVFDPATLGRPAGYRARDLVCLHAETPGLEQALATFSRCHVHPDDEIRYIIDGEGAFGVVLPGGGQAMLTVQAPEYIVVPQGLEHWFELTALRRCKAIRVFIQAEAWEATFTATAPRMAPTA